MRAAKALASMRIGCKAAMSLPVLSGHSKITLGFNTDYRLMQVKSIAEVEHSAILSTCIKLPLSFKTLFFLSF